MVYINPPRKLASCIDSMPLSAPTMMAASRIWQQLLRDYNPRTMLRCFSCSKVPALPLRWYPIGFEWSKGFRVGNGAPYSSASSAIANDSSDLAGVSSVNGARDTSEAPVSTDRLSPTENGRVHSSEEATSVAGGVVALGKFDALHIGHRELAIQASKIGVPYLMSFVGMAEVFGWEHRAPIVAKCDRKRVLSSWAPLCGNTIPKECHVEFSEVRHLTPEQFVKKLSDEFGVQGVVAGQNYRFGYKAAGNASDLVCLCKDYGMKSHILNYVMDKNQQPRGEEGSTNSQEKGQVSSTRVRYALSIGDMKYVSELLGRPHRLVLVAKGKGKLSEDGKRLLAPRSCLLNLPPTEGLYNNCSLVINGDENAVIPCKVIVNTTDIHLELAPDACISDQSLEEFLGIEFGESRALD